MVLVVSEVLALLEVLALPVASVMAELLVNPEVLAQPVVSVMPKVLVKSEVWAWLSVLGVAMVLALPLVVLILVAAMSGPPLVLAVVFALGDHGEGLGDGDRDEGQPGGGGANRANGAGASKATDGRRGKGGEGSEESSSVLSTAIKSSLW